MYNFLVEKYIFTIFTNERYKVKMEVIPEIHNVLGQNTSKYRSQIIVVHVHETVFF